MTRRALILTVWGAAGSALAAGGTALDAFNFTTGARAAGMGGAATAVVADPSALQWNPAALARMTSLGASASYLGWVAGISYSHAAFAVPVPAGFLGLPVNGTAGISAQLFDYGDIESTRGLASAVSASDVGLTVGGALRAAESISAGAAVKWFGHRLAGASANEAAIDAGAVYEAVPGSLTIAAVIQNLGYSGSLEGRRPPLPSSFKAGFAWGFDVTREPLPVMGEAPRWTPKVHAVIGGDILAYQRGEPVNYAVGAEAGLNGFLFARVGYLRTLKAAGGSAGLSAGLGLAWGALRLDFAYGSVGDLGRARFGTLSWLPTKMDKKKTDSEKPEEAIREDSNQQPSAGTQAVSSDSAYQSASDAYAAGRLVEARDLAASVVAVDPAHWQAWQLLGNCRYALGDREGAVAAYRSSLDVHPDNPPLKTFVDSLHP